MQHLFLIAEKSTDLSTRYLINVNERSMPIKKLYFKECVCTIKNSYVNQVNRKRGGFSLTLPQNNNFSTAESNRVPWRWLANEVKEGVPRT